MLGNLLDNACKWAARQCPGRGPSARAARCWSTIEDDGPGLPAERRAEVLERGRRLDEQVPGTGLGLAIVADIAQLYGGRLALERPPPGGLRAVLVLPWRKPDHPPRVLESIGAGPGSVAPGSSGLSSPNLLPATMSPISFKAVDRRSIGTARKPRMSPTINGLHHVTAISGAPQRNLDFYAKVLGLRFVKRTVNFDDPSVYHLYYGNETGAPGTAMAFFPWEHLPPARAGVPARSR